MKSVRAGKLCWVSAAWFLVIYFQNAKIYNALSDRIEDLAFLLAKTTLVEILNISSSELLCQ
jgi:hypothetical protein